MDSHLRDFALVLLAEARRIPQDRKVVVGRPRLEERLAPRDVRVQRAHLAPDRVARIHLQRRVEAPARPDRLYRRVAAAVVEYVVDARKEEPVQERLYLRRALAEMLVDPRTTFGGDELRALHVRGGRGELRNKDIAVVLAEHLGLGDIGERIEVEPVRGSAMRLVSRQVPVLTAPVRPHLEAGKLRFVDILAFLRLRAIVFVAVVVERARTRCDEDVRRLVCRVVPHEILARYALRRLAEPLVELRDVELHRLGIKRI